MNLENALTALVTLRHAKMAGDLSCGHLKACQNGGQLGIQ